MKNELARQMERDLKRERRALSEVKKRSRALVAAAVPVWHWGDGKGGEVTLQIMRVAYRRGLPIPKQWQAMI